MLKPVIVSLVIIPALFISFSCLAQKQILVGIKAGISIPNLHGSSSDNPVTSGWSSRLGPYSGLVAVYDLTKKISLQGEINYSSQGGKKNGKQAIATTNFINPVPNGIPLYVYAHYNQEVKLNYLELPVLIRYKLPITSQLNFFVNAGPYFSYLLSAKSISSGSSKVYKDEAEIMELSPQTISFDADADVKNDIEKFNVGVQGGVGLWHEFSSGALMLTAGGNYGFIPIQENRDNGKNNTGALTVTLGYLLKIH